jgi:Putative zinc-finger
MSHEDMRRGLDAYLEGQLDEAAQRTVRSHLEDCAACRDDLAGLQKLLEATRSLPASLEPSRDLWPGIETALGRRTPRGSGASFHFAARIFTRRPAWQVGLAAAAAAIVVWGGTQLILRRAGNQGARPPVAELPDGTSPGSTEGGPEIVILDDQARPLDAGWARMIWALEEQNLGAGKVLLATLAASTDPEAVQRAGGVIPGLRALDTAIDETAAALREDPDNPYLARTLTQHYEQKLELLRLAVRIANGQWT